MWKKFQSTRHLRGATVNVTEFVRTHPISIHAPLTWRDPIPVAKTILYAHFNPRATYVARPGMAKASNDDLKFQSTRHLRGATYVERCPCQHGAISIHAPLTWRDLQIMPINRDGLYFNPRATYVARQWR